MQCVPFPKNNGLDEPELHFPLQQNASLLSYPENISSIQKYIFHESYFTELTHAVQIGEETLACFSTLRQVASLVSQHQILNCHVMRSY